MYRIDALNLFLFNSVMVRALVKKPFYDWLPHMEKEFIENSEKNKLLNENLKFNWVWISIYELISKI